MTVMRVSRVIRVIGSKTPVAVTPTFTTNEFNKGIAALKASIADQIKPAPPAPVATATSDPATAVQPVEAQQAHRAPASGWTSLLDLKTLPNTGPTDEDVAVKRFDALPPTIQAHAQALGLSSIEIDLIEIGAALHQASKRGAGGRLAQVNPISLAQAMSMTTERAGQLMTRAAKLGFVKEVPLALTSNRGFVACL